MPLRLTLLLQLLPLYLLLAIAAASSAATSTEPPRAGRNISYDGRAVTVDGQRRLLAAGSMHYARSTPELWPALMARAKAGGIDVITTYVMWNLHEVAHDPATGAVTYDFVTGAQSAQLPNPPILANLRRAPTSRQLPLTRSRVALPPCCRPAQPQGVPAGAGSMLHKAPLPSCPVAPLPLLPDFPVALRRPPPRPGCWSSFGSARSSVPSGPTVASPPGCAPSAPTTPARAAQPPE